MFSFRFVFLFPRIVWSTMGFCSAHARYVILFSVDKYIAIIPLYEYFVSFHFFFSENRKPIKENLSAK